MLIPLDFLLGKCHLPWTIIIFEDALVTVRYSLMMVSERPLSVLLLMFAFNAGRVEAAALHIVVHGPPHDIVINLSSLRIHQLMFIPRNLGYTLLHDIGKVTITGSVCIIHGVDDAIVVDCLRALMNDSLLLVRCRQVSQMVALLLHEIIGVNIEFFVVLAYIL
jgi:hypothetical protein